MNRSLTTLALATLLGTVASLSAEEPHLEFVRALRARRYNDLAMEYLEKIRPAASPELARDLPLELARTRLELARQETDLGRRGAMYVQVRKELEQAIKSNPAREGEARLEIAQVAVLQGKAQLSRAERAETAAGRKSEMLRAREALADASKQLEAAADQVSAQIEKTTDPAVKRSLEDARLQADFQRGIALFDQALTWFALKEDLKGGEMIKEATGVFQKVAEHGDKNPSSTSWLAEAWIGRCYHEGGESAKARTRLENISRKAPPGAEAARRLADYFRILVLPATVQGTANPDDAVAAAALDWLKTHRGHADTPEGHAIAFRLAEIYYKKAEQAKDAKSKAVYFEQARQLYRQLEQTDNDYADQARDRKVRITFASQGGPIGDVTKFQTFEDCYVRAQYEAFKVGEDFREIKDPKERDKKRKQRYETIITALNRGLELAKTGKGGKVAERDVLGATAMLAFAHLDSGKYAGALKVAESLAYGKPQSSQAPLAAIYALQAYTQLLTDPALEEEERKNTIKGMTDLVDHVKKVWPDESVADHARHQLGLLLIREKRFPEAVAELATIKPGYAYLIQAKWQLAAAAFQADQDKAAPVGPDKRPFKEQALAALDSIPELPPGADPVTSHVYLSAKIQLGQQLFELKKFQEMEALAKPLLERLPKMNLENDEAREQLRAGLNALILYARYGLAEADYSAGKYAEVRKVLDPVIDGARDGKLPELKTIPQLRWALLGLALRANVLDNNMKRAQEVVQVLQKYADDKEGAGRTEAILQPIIKMMSDQIEELRRKGQKDELAKTVKGFADFLDILRGQQKKPTLEFQFLLSQSYVSLDKHAEALKLLEEIKAPADADEKANRLYRAARLLHVRALRKSGQLDKADEALKAIMAESWGKQNIEALKEEGHLLDAREKFGLAAQHWNGLLKPLQGRLQTDAAAKEQYFEVYFYLTRSYYRFGAAQTDKAKGDKYIKASAGFITKLETSWPDLGGDVSKARFEELRKKEPDLQKAYDQIKAENK